MFVFEGSIADSGHRRHSPLDRCWSPVLASLQTGGAHCLMTVCVMLTSYGKGQSAIWQLARVILPCNDRGRVGCATAPHHTVSANNHALLRLQARTARVGAGAQRVGRIPTSSRCRRASGSLNREYGVASGLRAELRSFCALAVSAEHRSRSRTGGGRVDSQRIHLPVDRSTVGGVALALRVPCGFPPRWCALSTPCSHRIVAVP